MSHIFLRNYSSSYCTLCTKVERPCLAIPWQYVGKNRFWVEVDLPMRNSCGKDWLLMTSTAHFAATTCWMASIFIKPHSPVLPLLAWLWCKLTKTPEKIIENKVNTSGFFLIWTSTRSFSPSQYNLINFRKFLLFTISSNNLNGSSPRPYCCVENVEQKGLTENYQPVRQLFNGEKTN